MAHETSNPERIGGALNILKQALRPYVEQQLRTTYGEHWILEVENSVRGAFKSKVSLSHPNDWDTQAILAIMWNNWNRVFGNTLGKIERNYISELQEVRNKWAHQRPFNNENTFRALGTMEQLLVAISAKHVDDIPRLKDEVFQLLVKEREKPVGLPPNDEPPVRGTESYHVYVNTRRPPGVAMIHFSSCSFANNGDGIAGKAPNQKSYWSPRLDSYANALVYSQRARTNIKIRQCKFCNPS